MTNEQPVAAIATGPGRSNTDNRTLTPTWRVAQIVPFRLTVTIPVLRMKLRDLRALQGGTLLLTAAAAAEDVPVRVGGAVMGWCELDHVDGQMAIRLTRLA